MGGKVLLALNPAPSECVTSIVQVQRIGSGETVQDYVFMWNVWNVMSLTIICSSHLGSVVNMILVKCWFDAGCL